MRSGDAGNGACEVEIREGACEVEMREEGASEVEMRETGHAKWRFEKGYVN